MVSIYVPFRHGIPPLFVPYFDFTQIVKYLHKSI